MASKKTESKKNEKTDKSEKALAAEKEQFVKLQVRFTHSFTSFNVHLMFSGHCSSNNLLLMILSLIIFFLFFFIIKCNMTVNNDNISHF